MGAARASVATLVFSVLSLWALTAASALTCSWGGTSTIAPPSATPLRSYRKPFHSPGRLAVDSAGQVYATDPRTGRVVVRDRYGRLVRIAEGFATPVGIAVDGSGRIYVGERGNGRVLVYDSRWNFLATLGAGDPEFVVPNGIAVDPDTGWIYVTDSGANQVRVYSADGRLARIFGAWGTASGQFRFPTGIYVGAGEVFVADQGNDRVQVFDPTGAFLRCFGGGGGMSMSKRFGSLDGLTGDPAGRLYVADAFQGWVQVFDRRGVLLGTIGGFGAGPGQLRTPTDVLIDASNRLFVASANNARLEVFGLDRFSDPQIVPAVVDVKPEALNRSSPRQSVTAYITLRDWGVDDIDPSSVTANGVPALPSPVAIGDYDADGIPDLMVKFDAGALAAALPDGDAIIVVTGQLRSGAVLFEGSDTVRVFSRGGGR